MKSPANAAASAKGDRRSSRPPRLKFNLVSQLIKLALMNIIPLFALVWMAGQYQLGLLGVREGAESLIPLAILLIIAAVLLLAATWIVLPTLRWARRWSAWQIDEPEGKTWLGMVTMPLAYVVSGFTWLFFLAVAVMLGFTIYHSFIAAKPVIEQQMQQHMDSLQGDDESKPDAATP